MQKPFLVLSFGVGALLLATSHAFGQTPRNCGDRDVIISRLAQSYGESRQSIGLGSRNRVVETFANRETGSWTITITLPDGTMCLMASGMAFEALDETVTPAGSDI